MYEELRILFLLLIKNLIVRKRHWIGSLVELILPVCVIAGILVIRSSFIIDPTHINETSSFPIRSKADLVNDYIDRNTVHFFYQPQNEFTDNLMEKATRCMGLQDQHRQSFDTEDDLLLIYKILQNTFERITVIAIAFANTSAAVPRTLNYTIRSMELIPETYFDFVVSTTASDRLIKEIPIVPLQMCVDDTFIDIVAPNGTTKPTVYIQKMPNPAYDIVNPLEILIQGFICSYGGMMFLAIIYMIITYVCAEKTSGVNTLLKMNGVKPYQNFLSWLVNGMIFSVIPVSGVTGILKWNLISNQRALYLYSNYSLIWFTLFLNIVHVYAFCLHMASYFSKPLFAKAVAVTVTVITNQLARSLEKIGSFKFMAYLGLFCPSVATTRLFDELNKHENTFTGAQWGNLFKTANPAFGITGSIGFIIVFSILGVILHFVFALYLAAVLPSKYDVPKSPLFFLKRFRKTRASDGYETACTQATEGQPQVLEPVADGAYTPSIQLMNMAKFFRTGFCKSKTVTAVKGVSMDFYKGQITALLGHNGAGKTTTFSILTGLTAPSRGTVYINGNDLSEDLDAIRSDLGVCTQENTMFPDLTVLEQVRLVGLIKQKDRTKKQLLQDVDDLLDKLDISKKRDVMPDKLSGGQKRKLCLAMALVGNASTLFLDEPTSGMDPEARRGTWDIILKYRQQRTIIITTHSMEEADVLGDRIAIMDSGHVKCYGTPMFLKKYYGHDCHDVTISTRSEYDEATIRDIFGSEAKMNTTHHGRIVMTIPFTNSLPETLDNIESQKAELGITGVSVSTMTLEEVFLKVAKEEISELVNDVELSGVPIVKEYKHLTGSELTWQRIRALSRKRLTYFKTDVFHYPSILLLALLGIVLPVLVIPDLSIKVNSNMLLDLGLYHSTEALIHSADSTLGETYKKIIENGGGTGTIIKAAHGLNNELLSRAKLDMAYNTTRTIISAEFNSSSIALGFYYGGAAVNAPITVNAMSNLVLNTIAGGKYSIVAKIGNLPQSLFRDMLDKVMRKVSNVSKLTLFIPMFFNAIALFVKHPLMENSTKVKQLQQMTGVSSFMYWGTMFVIDYAFYVIVTVFSVIGIFLTDFFGESNTIPLTECGFLLLLFLLFGINALLLSYIHSFIKKRYNIVGLILSLVPTLTLFVTLSLYKALPMIKKCENCENYNIIQRRIFSLHPHVSFVFGYLKFIEIASSYDRCQRLPDYLDKVACLNEDPYWGFKCSNGHCANSLTYIGDFRKEGGFEEFVSYLLFSSVALVCILCLLEQQIFAKLRLMFRKKTKRVHCELHVITNSLSTCRISERQLLAADIVAHSDIEKEKYIVRGAIHKRFGEKNPTDDNVFLAYGLSKHYGKLKAVKEMNFRVTKNECFGLLGVNGAGKSTTFRMIVGQEVPTGGILYRGSHSINSNRSKYLAGMGYCPQNDALIPYFNAVDHLSLVAALRGVPVSEVATEVQLWINQLRLNKHARNKSKTYSGGNKRRLNIAMALIASHKMVLLDEPTTGVDPVARRSIWTILQNCQASGQAIILTSHSMEECEVLCNRLAIMVKGRLLCIGASQELKDRFGAGFNITVKLNPERTEQDVMDIKEKIQTAFACELKDEHPGQLFYHITDSNETWVKMYGTMNRIKYEYNCFEDFTVTTSTLEQLFIQFARSSADTEA